MSFDDTWQCLYDLITNNISYSSIFDNAFLNDLKDVHSATGMVFTLNCFNTYSGQPSYNISDLAELTKFKDEFKDTEGNPQIKGKIKQLQYQMAARRMMKKVPEADVVVTNPTHYAVALKYDPNGTTAPLVVAKGVDEIAEKIKEIARESEVPVIPLPPLARSLYYTTDLDCEIPRGLFKAVAQVLAWVMGMKSFKEGKSKQRPRDLDMNLPIPDELKF